MEDTTDPFVFRPITMVTQYKKNRNKIENYKDAGQMQKSGDCKTLEI